MDGENKMKDKKDIEDMKSFVSSFNDGKFMNQDFRAGLLTALDYCLGNSTQVMHFIEENYIKKEED